MEYEVDELRREATLMRAALEKGIDFTCVHDTCVVAPGELASGTGNQYAVYTPWYRAWCAYLHKHPTTLDEYPAPAKVADGLMQNIKPLFETPIPPAPPNKSLSAEEKKRFKSMWPPGEHEAKARLAKFLNERGKDYADKRNLPGTTGTSSLSVHFAAGTMATRTAVREAKAKNNGMLDGGSAGLKTWISEVAWRDFYKHVLVHWPYVCMNKPFKPAYSSIAWTYNPVHLSAWTLGQTGYPIVDAAMRQLLHTGWMHNRCRMIVASFLAKDLLIDWRLGERHFMEHLIDGDFASNNGGWGFSASTGVDPQPYFRIFNPKLQSERFDPEGEYIRKWVPELREVRGKAIHEPGKVKGYPAPVVEHKESRARALARYKEGLERGEG
ncbi:MAG: hypothetical protein M1824_000586 [Vezdaea acicularis]|nr:MAG: hypothetical protein M1824_000586 [Vezdaea acicularis]